MQSPMNVPVRMQAAMRQGPGPAVVGRHDAEDGRGGAGGEAGRQVDLAEQQDEDQAHRDDHDAGRLVEEVGEVELVRERVAAQRGEDDDQHDQPEDGGQRADVAAADLGDVVAEDRCRE